MSVFWRPRGCVLWFDFAELQGDTVYDLSGNNNHGTIYNCEWRRGHLVGSLYFNGTDAYVYVDNIVLDVTTISEFAIEILIYPLSTEDQVTIFQGEGGEFQWRVFWGGDFGFFYTKYTDGTTFKAYLPAKPINRLYYIVFNYRRGGTSEEYVNGVLEDTWSTPDKDIQPFSDYFSVGCWQRGVDFFTNAIIHFCRIYNRALSEREIRAHANYLLQKYIAHPPFI